MTQVTEPWSRTTARVRKREGERERERERESGREKERGRAGERELDSFYLCLRACVRTCGVRAYASESVRLDGEAEE